MPATHLRYDTSGEGKVVSFECQLTVGKDPFHTFYVACGFARGYLGMQVNSKWERRLLFSVWDDGKKAEVSVQNAHPHALVKPFKGEGEGMQAMLQYRWEPNKPYQFRVTAKPNPEANSTIYSGFAFLHDQWTLIASFGAPSDGSYLRGLYSFLENFGPCISDERQCHYSQIFIEVEGSDVKLPIRKCKCSSTKIVKKGDFYDFAVENDGFCMTINGPKGQVEDCTCRPRHLCL